MELTSYFDDFLSKTRPTPRQKDIMISEHKVLRERLLSAPTLKPILLATFIQGSQRRYTANRGTSEHPCDVDVVAVTNLPRSSATSSSAHGMFKPFLEEHYPGQFEPQERSWCITVDNEVTIDLVPTSEPESPALREALVSTRSLRDWNAEPGPGLGGDRLRTITEAMLEEAERDQDFDKSEPLWIPDRKLKIWEKTHPLFLIGWTARKNRNTAGHYVHVVRLIKWWRREVEPLPKHPKGYPLEHMVGDCCPDEIGSVAAGLAATFSNMASKYSKYAATKTVPFLRARGVADPVVDVMRRVNGADFASFHARLANPAGLVHRALNASTVEESAKLWGQLLGPEFPLPPSGKTGVTGGFVPPARPAKPQPSRFA